jgi:hypothetical protein
MNFFERFAKITGKDLPAPESLTLEHKCALTHQLRLSGESMIAIADYLGVTRQTAYNYYNKAKNERLMELENKTYLDYFVDRLHELEAQRDRYRIIIEDIVSNGDGPEEIDPDTGRIIPKTSHMRNINELGRLVMSYDKLILDMEFAVGLIPKNDPESIYGKLSDRNPDNDRENKEMIDMSDEELSTKLLNTLVGSRAKLGGNVLKTIKDEKVI